MKKKKIFNESVVMFFFIGILFLFLGGVQQISEGWLDSISTSILFFLVFMIFYLLGWMGAGDVKLGAALAFCLGLQLFLYVLALSSGIAMAYSVFLKFFPEYDISFVKNNAPFQGRTVKNVPYGAFLSMATMAVILGGR